MNVKEIVTERILRALEQGEIPWVKPWTGAHNAVSKKEYRGINRLLLPTEKYKCNAWLTFNQCRDLGGRVKKDERGSMVVFYKTSMKTIVTDSDEESNGITQEKRSFVLRYYTVFNIEQTSLDPADYTTMNIINTDKTADDLRLDYDCEIEFAGSRACYCPTTDKINVPPMTQFKTTEDFYSTLFHEMSHSTGHKKRLNRDLTGFFGSSSYAKEELIAEISSAMILHSIGMVKTIENTAAYCQSWIKALQNDKNMIILAAGKAEKSFQYITKSETVNV